MRNHCTPKELLGAGGSVLHTATRTGQCTEQTQFTSAFRSCFRSGRVSDSLAKKGEAFRVAGEPTLHTAVGCQELLEPLLLLLVIVDHITLEGGLIAHQLRYLGPLLQQKVHVTLAALLHTQLIIKTSNT